ncbi:hypothetical protein VKT23_019763 [Stygiomarasmius scandens]|uniref:Uncharacterized protein n=1 Tax=Marasmiellus scandens TaxID=2682957 RepID=A0ABR1ILZ4_9AGAR
MSTRPSPATLAIADHSNNISSGPSSDGNRTQNGIRHLNVEDVVNHIRNLPSGSESDRMRACMKESLNYARKIEAKLKEEHIHEKCGRVSKLREKANRFSREVMGFTKPGHQDIINDWANWWHDLDLRGSGK